MRDDVTLKLRPLLVVVLLVLSALAFIAPAYATTEATTFQASYTGAWPNYAIGHCSESGTSTAFDFTPSGNTQNCDSGTQAYVQAFAPPSSKTVAYNAFGGILNASALAGAWLMPGTPTSGTPATIPDFSHNNLTGTTYNSPTFTTGPFSGSAYLAFSGDTMYATYSYTPGTSVACTGIVKPTALSDSTYNVAVNSLCGVYLYYDGTTEYLTLTGLGLGYVGKTAIHIGSREIYYALITPSAETFYINGTQVGTASGSSTIPSGTQYIGGGGSHSCMCDISITEDYSYVPTPSQISESYSYLTTVSNPQPLEVTVPASASTQNFTYYEQHAVTVDSGSTYYDTGVKLTASVTGTYWVDQATTVTQPIKITSTHIGTFALSPTYSISPCDLSVTSIPSDSAVHDVTEYSGCKTTITVPTDGTTTRFRFASSATTVGYTASTTEYDVTAYYQDGPTLSYSIIGGGTPTAPTFSGTAAGATYTPTLTTTATQYWFDDGSTWSITNPLTGSGTTERWDTGQATSGTISVFTENFAYYNQYSPKVTFTLTDSLLTTTPTFTYVEYGASVTQHNSKTGINPWIDSGSTWSAQNPFVTSPDLKTEYGNVTSGTISSANHITIAYAPATSCVGSTPLKSIENGCIVPGIVGTWGNFLGTAGWFSFVLLGVNVAVYHKSQSVMVSLIILMVMGGMFGFLFPQSFSNVAEALIAIGIAGIAVKAILAVRT